MARHPDARTDDPTTTPPSEGVRDTGHPRDLVVELPSNGPAIGGLVTGMLAATLGFLVISAPAAILLGIAAIILGGIGVSRAGKLGGLLKGTAMSGIVSGLLGLLLGLAVVIGGVTLVDRAAEDPAVQQQFEELRDEIDRLTVPELDDQTGS